MNASLWAWAFLAWAVIIAGFGAAVAAIEIRYRLIDRANGRRWAESLDDLHRALEADHGAR